MPLPFSNPAVDGAVCTADAGAEAVRALASAALATARRLSSALASLRAAAVASAAAVAAAAVNGSLLLAPRLQPLLPG